MSDANAPAGWYPDVTSGDRRRWWDGSRWTDAFEPEAPQPEPISPRPRRRPGQLATIGILAGVLVVVVGLILGISWGVNHGQQLQRADEFCARWNSDTGVLGELAALAPTADSLWATGGTEAERTAFADQLDAIDSRLVTITTYSGFDSSVSDVWERMVNLDFEGSGNYQNDGLAAVVRAGAPATSGGIGMDYRDAGPSWVDGLGQMVADAARDLKPDVVNFCG